MRYEDTDNNGFIDKIEMDIDGDTIFEKTVLLKEYFPVIIPVVVSIIKVSTSCLICLVMNSLAFLR